MSTILEAKKINKSFPGVQALKDVSVSIDRGEVHAIVGENGAGKSTLMKIFGGVYTQDSGDILIEGEKKILRSVKVANNEGLAVIFQEYNLMSELTVAENINITRLPRVKYTGFLQLLRLGQVTQDLLEELKIELDPNEYVKNLTVHQKQLVEIVKAISINASILIMDEPTAALSDTEVDKLFRIIGVLKQEGKTILYVSHRLKEIFDIADRVTVLRDGRYIGTKKIEDIDQEEVVRMMVGRDIDKFYQISRTEPGNILMKVDSLSKKSVFENISFSLRKGEILGVAGLMGCGREELLKSIYGLETYDSGKVYLGDKEMSINNPRLAMNQGIAFVSEDRKESGIFPLMGVRENATINIIRKLSYGNSILINFNRESRLFQENADYLKLKYAGENQLIMNLSGGNQQKVVLARALMTDCDILILLEPTRGIDVGAKLDVYNLMSDLTSRGIGIILISSDLPELISMSDRVMVMWQGRMTGMLDKDEIDEETIMLCATGNKDMIRQEEEN